MIDYGGHKKPSHARRDRPAFDDVVGQRELKEALLAVAVDDDLDGLLVQGEKGTAKSTAVQGLADLLPDQRAVADCEFGCHPEDPALQCADCQSRADPPMTTRPVPLVTLPLGATRERVVGTLSVSDALDGEHTFDPGLLARAHRGILYVDEVNLLDDHLVDVLLSAAASGVNRVERDGVSVTHPAAFALVGTMNPEEGDLRPQLRDRFALQATVTGCDAVDDRVAIIDQALDDDTAAVEPDDDGNGDDSRERLLDARTRIDDVSLSGDLRAEVAELCRDAGVDGHRGDIATARTARALAALDGRDVVEREDVEAAARYALPHRLRTQPFEDAPDAADVIDEHFEDGDGDAGDGDDGANGGEETGDGDASADGDGRETTDDAADPGGDEGGTTAGDAAPEPDGSDEGEGTAGAATPTADDGENTDDAADDGENTDDAAGDGEKPGDDTDGDASQDASPRPRQAGGDGREDGGFEDADAERPDADADDEESGTPLVAGQERAGVGEATAPDLEPPDPVGDVGSGSGSRAARSPSVDATGPRVRTERADASSSSVDAAASVRAASARGADAVESRDLRASVRAGEASALVLFVVDASASMRPAMRAAKGTVLDLLEDAYQHRDAVGFVAFAGEDAEVLLPPTDSVTLAARHLKSLPTGDRTPLPAGLRTAGRVLDRADPAASVVVVVTDGRANVADGSPVAATRRAARGLAERDAAVVVVDAGGDERATVTDALVAASDGERVPLSALTAERVDATVADAAGRGP
ncbi:VWA domain-containing protein [Halorubellus sp. JP-L1]|uniref:VWA domain-containing protein n=1 Tax=Halorubellus sp. JP-L1 TaxID=2715753 RepID=UPI001409782B|nr:VWA domain-containing protein [Halorubellus sp. JP-L1]NHN41677.1 VWA domain-containing protein [Halorubellus sp. JP-L1]